MPLVFVHGVSVRKDQNYVLSEAARNGLFRKYALTAISSNPSQVVIENPYWGQFGAALAWNGASLPDRKYEDFGTSESVFESILNELASDIQSPSEEKVLLTLAQKSLERAVDCLWTAGAYCGPDASNGEALAELSSRALQYARAKPKPEWLSGVADDSQLVERLLTELEMWRPAAALIESFGVSDVWNHLKTAAVELGQNAAALVVNPSVRAVRPQVNAKVAIFLGDAFIYLKTRDEKEGGPIVGEILSAFRRAEQACNDNDDKMIIVAHSMGGNISYDVLTSFAKDLSVDLFVTVGSQVGLFEELKLFKASEPDAKAPATVPKPDNIRYWINVVGPNDILAYSTGKIFANSKDTTLEDPAPVWAAHTTYFSRPIFHERLSQRMLG